MLSVSVTVSTECIGQFGFLLLVSNLNQNRGFGCTLDISQLMEHLLPNWVNPNLLTLASGKSRWNDKDTLHVKVCTKIVKVWFYHRKILCHIKFKEIQKNVYIHTFSKKRTKVDYQCYKLFKVHTTSGTLINIHTQK